MEAMEAIITTDAPPAIGPYSQGMMADRLTFVSGQIPLDPVTGELVGGDIRHQTAQVIKNMQSVLRAKNLDLPDVIKTTVFLKDIGDFPSVNEVYQHLFGDHRPARSTVQVAALPKGALIEIECIAFNRHFS